MGCWTHIVAVIDVNVLIESRNLKEEVEKILEQAPKITGDEGDADVFVNVLSGYNSSTSSDCKNCIYKDTIIHHKKGGFSCDAEDDYICPYGEYQTRVVITVIGNLENRFKEDTNKEFKTFYKFIKSKFKIKNKSVKIID